MAIEVDTPRKGARPRRHNRNSLNLVRYLFQGLAVRWRPWYKARLSQSFHFKGFSHVASLPSHGQRPQNG
jgi:hypothetical protein